jgi:Flp pilus assembly protein TadD
MNISKFLRDSRVRRLDARARELIDVGLYEEALAKARKLRALRHGSVFEIEARAYTGLERHEDAVQVLREGLALTPDDWRNWLLLGSCLANLGRFDDTARAYDRAEQCTDCDKNVLEVNREILVLRRLDPLTPEQAADRIKR